ncbi:hypothetical protein TCAL_13921 [Tigriopus californicus]|uniref:DUF4794 domain-containing protein n=1 Tax=Tigriopus californicus TaxID=6832 RepID=A0A553N8Q0_TIGCA|nr:uncharacterized protein LOC131885031 [Tigriopus californicus]TRY61816.1 hypothetical protein TCAL_13921 [Tigriopus californicus]|eukprot:TCALIF_13921-PA protein Name:"Protein of unknown function" AED:0.00 eAED:0.00 QI:37/1/1/1/1/1/3/127/234
MKYFIIFFTVLAIAASEQTKTNEVTPTETVENTPVTGTNPVTVDTSNLGDSVQAFVDSRQVYASPHLPVVPVYFRQLPVQNPVQAVPHQVQPVQQPVVQYVPVAMVMQDSGRIIPFGGGVSGNVGPLGASAGLGYTQNNGFGAGFDFGLGNKYTTYGAQPTYQTYYNPQPVFTNNPQPIYTTNTPQTTYTTIPQSATTSSYHYGYGRALDSVNAPAVQYKAHKQPVAVPYFYRA